MNENNKRVKSAEKKNKMNGHIRTEKRTVIVVLSVMLALFFVVAVRFGMSFLKIKSFEISGDTKYMVGELVSASGIRRGDYLYRIDESKAEKQLLEECPFLAEVEINKKFPNKICFEVEERNPQWYLDIAKEFYVLDYDMLVLLETSDEDSLKERGLTKLVLPQIEKIMCGEYPEFASEDEISLTKTLEIIDVFRNHSIKSRLTYLDISNRFSIKMKIDDIYDVDLGDMSNIDKKFSMLLQMLERDEVKSSAGGKFTVVGALDISFQPYYDSGTENGDAGEDTAE